MPNPSFAESNPPTWKLKVKNKRMKKKMDGGEHRVEGRRVSCGWHMDDVRKTPWANATCDIEMCACKCENMWRVIVCCAHKPKQPRDKSDFVKRKSSGNPLPTVAQIYVVAWSRHLLIVHNARSHTAHMNHRIESSSKSLTNEMCSSPAVTVCMWYASLRSISVFGLSLY